MGKTTYSKLRKTLEDLQGRTLTVNKLRVLIIKNIGGDERTISACLRIMAETKLIKDIGNCKFEVL